jgi:SNF2 family DNA or RNA helicase
MMRKPFTPRPYHGLAMEHLANAPRSAIFAKPGMGKSVMALTFLDYLHNVWGESRPTLVLAPLRVARDTWANEAHKWGHLAGLEVVPIVGGKDQRLAALRQQAPVYATNYDNLVWLKDHYEGKAWPFATVIADESTKLKSFRLRQGGVRAQALAQVAHKDVERWVNLTGTPASNGLEDLWGQTWFLDAGVRLGRTFSAFRDRWFRPVKSGDFHNYRPTDYAQEEIQQRIADICLTLDPKDWFDLKDPIVNVIEVELPASARSKYREMERELFTMIGDTEVEAFNAAAKSQKCLQMANGAVYLEAERYGAGTWIEVHMEKLDALEELMEETGDDPLLVAYQFQSDLARLQRRFPDALVLATPEGMAAAMAGQGKLWLGHPASMGHGVDGLQYHCNTVVFFAQDWNLEYHDQMLERVGPVRQLQAGKDRGVFVHYIVARGTIDELVMARRESKRSVQDLLLDYLKGKR